VRTYKIQQQPAPDGICSRHGGSGSGLRRPPAVGVLSRCVKDEAAARNAAAVAQAAAACTMLLMPGADVAPADAAAREEDIEAAAAVAGQGQLKISYGGCVLVFDDVPADRASELARVAAWREWPAGAADAPVARKASLQRFIQKRQDRLHARAPYARQETPYAMKGKHEGDAGRWLGLGISGAGRCAR
jgi:jasmonate ZIM domain-containing protein